MPEFNLVDEKWIPCLMSGTYTRKEFSLRECLLQAHDIQEVIHNSPLVTVALHRLLLAVIHAGFRLDENGQLHCGPRSFEEWKQLWSTGQFDDRVTNTYLDKWKPRFNLFDTKRPFYQVPMMWKEAKKEKSTETPLPAPNAVEEKKSSKKKKPKSDEPELVEIHPIALLSHEAATGSNATLFDHSFKSANQIVSAAEAARYLIANQSFAIGGGNSQPFNLSNAPLVNGYTLLITGNNLFETLMLNLIIYTDERPVPVRKEKDQSLDAPVWEQEILEKPNKDGTIARGYLDYLTWQSRRIHLVAETDGTSNTIYVCQCQLMQNLALAKSPIVYDPFKSYKEDDKTKDISPGKAVWRDSHALFQQNDAQANRRRPAVFDLLEKVEQERQQGEIEAQPAYSFTVYGFANDKASVFLWSREQMPLPLTYLHDPNLVQSLENAINLAGSIHDNLLSGIKALAEGLFPKDEQRQASKAAEEIFWSLIGIKKSPGVRAEVLNYWSRLDTPFRKLLVNLPNNHADDEREWAATLEKTAKDALDKIINGLDGSAKCFRAATIAQEKFDDLMKTTRRKNQFYFPPSQIAGGKQ